MKLSKVFSAFTFLACLMTLGISGQAQTQSPNEQTPSFRVTVVSRTTRAVKYQHRSGATRIDFQGTDLMPSASGEAKVNSKRGAVEIEVEFKGLQQPTTFGNEYLTYILWAVSPEGRAVNIGEVLLGGNSSKLDVTTDLQTFALIVTAEPYYAVRRPSNVVVMENVVRPDTAGTTEVVDAKYELLDRGGYVPTGYKFDPVVLNAKLPLEFYEARNALRIAKSAGAERYAAPSYENAMGQMKQADDLAIRKNVQKKDLIAASREAVQTAEDAREIAMKHLESDRLESERRAAEGREADAKTLANQESQRRISAEADTAEAKTRANEESQRRIRAEADTADAKTRATYDSQRRISAETDTADAKTLANQESQRRISAEADSTEAKTRANDESQRRIRAEADTADAKTQATDDSQRRISAETDTADAKRQRDEAERKSHEAQADAREAARGQATAEQGRADAQAESDRNRTAAISSDQQLQQAIHDREELRGRLLQQLNLILETHDTARGLVVNMSDVLFDSGQFTLRPVAREKLAKVSGIVLAYPTLKLAIEGNTDSVGGDAYNQQLSESRANAVRTYLTQQGISQNTTSATGFGKTRPIASNDTAEGRQQNRRVELVVSGEVIGTTTSVLKIEPIAQIPSSR